MQNGHERRQPGWEPCFGWQAEVVQERCVGMEVSEDLAMQESVQRSVWYDNGS